MEVGDVAIFIGIDVGKANHRATTQAGAGAGALPDGTMSVYNYMGGPGPHTPPGLLQATAAVPSRKGPPVALEAQQATA